MVLTIFSMISYLLFWLVGPFRPAFVIVLGASTIILGTLAWRKRQALAHLLRALVCGQPSRWDFPALAAVVLVAGTAGWSGFCLFLLSPHGAWDAWAIWNLKARFLARAEDWRAMFHPAIAWSHPDYPMLLPSLVGWLWVLGGTEAVAAPMLTAFGFLAGLGLAAGGAVSHLRGRAQGMAAAAVVWGTPSVVVQGASQYADAPLAFFIATTLAVVAVWEAGGRTDAALPVLAGFLGGGAAWTKNEGLLFLVLLIVLLFACHARESFRAAVKFSGLALLGALPPLLLVIIHKVSSAAPTDLWATASAATLSARLGDLERYRIVLLAFLQMGFSFGETILPVVPLLLLYAGLKGRLSRCPGSRRAAGLRIPPLALLFMSAGYFMVYVLSPQDLEWHLATTLPRLWLHLYPSLVIVTLGAGSTRQTAADT